jgi:hypothetical protein
VQAGRIFFLADREKVSEVLFPVQDRHARRIVQLFHFSIRQRPLENCQPAKIRTADNRAGS